jgi:regulator of cell morphogenesis and NO signaling
METINLLDVRKIEPKEKHPSIFHAFDKLETGEILTILNDHDPLPLYYQFKAERPEQFTWKYILEGPEEWEVAITKTKSVTGLTVGEIVRDNPAAASIFKKFKIDYCCHGKRPLESACEKAGVNSKEVLRLIEEATSAPNTTLRVQNWPLDALVDYIINNHHSYVRSSIIDIKALLDKVAKVHGAGNFELFSIRQHFIELANEMESHMMKEEQVLFPVIKDLVQNRKHGGPCNFGSIDNPIAVMEMEHEDAGNLLEMIKKESDNFTPPAYACTSYKLVYKMLKDFEDDLHQHIHLENNILFPKAQALEKRN